ncbi:Alcohol dehydrogenase GroES-like domain-containing protein [Cladophialophora immunda]|nr:Alcohol dehydrogenase GroES-like domain-containing protein [Cladophialophora immunda]
MVSLPDTHHALVLSSLDAPLEVKSIAAPELIPGSAIVQVLSSPVLAYAAKLYSGALQYPLHPPMTVGGGAIGRIVAVGSDATHLAPGQLVLVDPMIRGRDDPAKSILLGVHGGLSEGAARLMKGDWRDGSCAEFARWPLENIHALDEDKLKDGLGYSHHEMAYIIRFLVPLGGLAELDVRAGDRVVIAPATGQFGGAAVEVALALGADVVICGRKKDVLEGMKATLGPVYPRSRIDAVALSGTVDTDVAAIQHAGPVDKYLDFSPAAAAGSTHITSCLMSLRKGGRACFQGGIAQPVPIPYLLVMFNDLVIGGKFMYEREAIRRAIALVESGRLRFELPGLKAFGLREWRDAFAAAERNGGWRQMVVLEPAKQST